MKILVLGVYHRRGKGKESGNDYDMKMMVVAEPMTTFNSVKSAYGYRAVEYNVSDNFYPELIGTHASTKFPQTLDLEMGLLNARPLIVGFMNQQQNTEAKPFVKVS